MNINRSNYEEYFMLYVDCELSATDREAVETFINQHPDLAAELELLKETILSPEQFVMPGKQELFNFSAASISQGNYDEQFLLYVDNELSEDEKQHVETFVLQNPETQETFLQLKQAVLPAEHIDYPNKEELYRKEKDRKPVVYMLFQRLAVAAVFTGLLIGGWWLFQQENQVNSTGNNKNFAKLNKMEDKNSSSAVTKTEEETYNNQTRVIAKVEETTAGSTKVTLNPSNSFGSTKVLSKHQVPDQQPDLKQKGISIRQGSDDQTGFVSSNPVNKPVQQLNQQETDRIREAILKPIASEPFTASSVNFINTEDVGVLKELNTDEEEKPGILVGNLELNKSKLKGIFKKASKLFTGNKSTETTGKLQIANLEIDTRK